MVIISFLLATERKGNTPTLSSANMNVLALMNISNIKEAEMGNTRGMTFCGLQEKYSYWLNINENMTVNYNFIWFPFVHCWFVYLFYHFMYTHITQAVY